MLDRKYSALEELTAFSDKAKAGDPEKNRQAHRRRSQVKTMAAT